MPVTTYLSDVDIERARKSMINADIDLKNLLYDAKKETGVDIIVQRDIVPLVGLLRKEVLYRYKVYFPLGNGEYQIMNCASGFKEILSAFLYGFLIGNNKNG